MKQRKYLLLFLVLCLLGTMVSVASCSASEGTAAIDSTKRMANRVWAFAKSHPEGFTLDVHTMTEPSEGIAVSYAETQGSHSRESLRHVVSHALAHEGYVGGWLDRATGLYNFDSTRLFSENDPTGALLFGADNGQQCVFILSSATDVRLTKVSEIRKRGRLRVGTTGDYRPLSYLEPATRQYWGFGIDLARLLAERLGVEAEFVQTSWPTLAADVLREPQIFDLAMGGITITDARQKTMAMSEGYLANGKTILCRAEDAARFRSLGDVDLPEVRVMVNPGGLNENFARAHLTKAQILVWERNEEIPSKVAEGEADVMITEITEAPYYTDADKRLAAPLLEEPFTHGQIWVLMPQGQDDLMLIVNAAIREMKADGTLRKLCEKYGLVYAYGD